MSFGKFSDRLLGFYVRNTARFFARRLLAVKTPVPLISFTFDDFPRAALLGGGAILNRSGVAGTFYAAFGLMGKQSPTGQIFLREDLRLLQEQGHELGCHTFGHLDAWKTDPDVFEKSIAENRRALGEVLPGASFQSFSYPKSPPNARTKRLASRHFQCCRGGGQTFNSGYADLNYLAAYFLEKSRDNTAAVKEIIDRNQRARGWLILATHDVSETHSPFGCRPDFFEEIVQYAVASGARVLPVAQALEVVRASAQK